ncbi:ABC transporter ATP-binding protein [Stappia sp. ICDLI1TA098]
MPEASLHRIPGAHGQTTTPSDPALLETRDLAFRAGTRTLVDNVDLSIAAGRTTMIMGANGAGKSLLLRLVHGLIAPTSGEIAWRGRPLDRAARDAQAMVFQRPVMLRRSVMANLAFALAVRGIRGRERAERIRQALEQANLSELARQPARVLSGGEQQRLAVVRALACDPQLLLLDEPTASLDPASTLAIEDLVRGARARGVTVAMITHDVGQARRLGDDVAFLHGGRLVETGPAERVLTSPRSPAARAWLEGRLVLDPPAAQATRNEG